MEGEKSIVKFNRRLNDEPVGFPRAVVAHEIGHVATEAEDLLRRNAPEAEWAHEATADWYASKWGFRDDLERSMWPTRDFGHHGPSPGETITYGDVVYRVTQDFVFEEVGP